MTSMYSRAVCVAVGLAGSFSAVLAQTVPTGTVIVSNMDAQSVWLVDLATGEERGIIPARAAPHEVAVSGDGRTVAVTNYGAPGVGNLVQFLDLTTGMLTDEQTVEGYERLHGATFLPGDSLLALTSERTSELIIVGRADGVTRRAFLVVEQRCPRPLRPDRSHRRFAHTHVAGGHPNRGTRRNAGRTTGMDGQHGRRDRHRRRR